MRTKPSTVLVYLCIASCTPLPNSNVFFSQNHSLLATPHHTSLNTTPLTSLNTTPYTSLDTTQGDKDMAVSDSSSAALGQGDELVARKHTMAQLEKEEVEHYKHGVKIVKDWLDGGYEVHKEVRCTYVRVHVCVNALTVCVNACTGHVE